MSRTPDDCEKRISPDYRKRLLDLIFDQECTKAEFAQLVGVNKEVITRATVYSIVPSVKSLIKIADFLNISLEYLLAETDKNVFYKSESPTTFHYRIEQLRKEKNEKYSTICRSMPFQKNSFYEWLRTGSLPTLEYLEAIAQYFDVSLDYLLGRTDYRNN